MICIPIWIILGACGPIPWTVYKEKETTQGAWSSSVIVSREKPNLYHSMHIEFYHTNIYATCSNFAGNPTLIKEVVLDGLLEVLSNMIFFCNTMT